MRAAIPILLVAVTAAAEPDPARRDAEAGFAALQAGKLDRAPVSLAERLPPCNPRKSGGDATR
jgi:hypothetical protein